MFDPTGYKSEVFDLTGYKLKCEVFSFYGLNFYEMFDPTDYN